MKTLMEENWQKDKITSMHRVAMEYAESAASLKNNNTEHYKKNIIKAYEMAWTAAVLAMFMDDFEPTISILLYSAASLAQECGDFRESEILCCNGLLSQHRSNDFRDLLKKLHEEDTDLRLRH